MMKNNPYRGLIDWQKEIRQQRNVVAGKNLSWLYLCICHQLVWKEVYRYHSAIAIIFLRGNGLSVHRRVKMASANKLSIGKLS